MLGGAEQHRRRPRTGWSSSSTTTAGRTLRPSAAWPTHLTTLRLNPGYEKVLDLVKDALGSTPMVGKPMYEVLHAVKRGIKDAISPQPMFEDLGLKYVGPVDGHDEQAVESALRRAKGFNAPVIVHAVTRKGYGYRPAEEDEADCLHGPSSAFSVETGKLLAAAEREVDACVRRRAGRGRRRAPGHRGHHRRDGRADRHRRAGPEVPGPGLRRRHRRAARRDLARPGWPWAGCTRWSPSTPPSSTGPSTRSCWTWPCTGCR